MAFYCSVDEKRSAVIAGVFAENCPGVDFFSGEISDEQAARVRYLFCWKAPADLARRFPALEVIFSSGAGVEQFLTAELPQGVRIIRMTEPGITRMMQEYVVMAVLSLFRNLPAYLDQARSGTWAELPARTPGDYRLGVMGLGQLGCGVIEALRPFGFALSAWARSPREIAGVSCSHGAEALPGFLAQCDLLICLLPLTDETRSMINAEFLSRLPRGASLVLAGRGGQTVQKDLLAALESGQISSVFMDVTDPEPLPSDHPLWRHPGVILTPHIACTTDAKGAGEILCRNLGLLASGEVVPGEVDFTRGY